MFSGKSGLSDGEFYDLEAGLSEWSLRKERI
jgi:hypothetical protein